VIESGNKAVSDTLDSVQKTVDSYGKNIAKDGLELAKKKTLMSNPIQTAGGSIKKFHREAIIIGGRTNKSKLYFLTPLVNSSKIVQQHGGKRSSRRQNRGRNRLLTRKR